MVTIKDRRHIVSACICISYVGIVDIILSSCLVEAEKQAVLEALLQTLPQKQGNFSNRGGGK